jgi:tRNA pseudouridine(38-40) synthase
MLAAEAEADAGLSLRCSHCAMEFSSRNSLFRHLNQEHSHGAPGSALVKVALLVSFLGNHHGKRDASVDQAETSELACQGGRAVVVDAPEERETWVGALWAALSAVGSSTRESAAAVRPQAWSRAQGTESRGTLFFSQPSYTPSVSELVCLRTPPIKREATDEWVRGINSVLPASLRVLGRCDVPNSAHAEKHCETRCYGVLVPLSVLAPDLRQRSSTVFEGATSSFSPAWIERFRRMKLIMQRFQKRANWHNYCPGVLPHDAIAKAPKVIRFRHVILGPVVDDSNNEFAILALHGSHFLRGMVQAIVSMAIAVYRGWLPEEAIEQSFRPDVIMSYFPVCPDSTTYFENGRYDNFENKFHVVLQPRRISDDQSPSASHPPSPTTGGDSGLSAARPEIELARQRIIRELMELETKGGNFRSWAIAIEAENEKFAASFEKDCCIAAKSTVDVASLAPDQLSAAVLSGFSPNYSLSPDIAAIYGRTLELLREADTSGKWPGSSSTRARVIEPGFKGGTFALGTMPPPLEKPRSNEFFFDLMYAAFALERAISPKRPPSSTIAVNRNCKFNPHTDSGSGAGQSTSLIVGLGDYTGGELVVEGIVNDIRYKPLSFNGWTQRHWTLPFEGERFSLVWFTPRGCEGKSGLALCELIASGDQ